MPENRNRLSATEVHFRAYELLQDARWTVRPERSVPTTSKRYRAGRIRADLAITHPDGHLLYLVEAKDRGAVNFAGRQYEGYRGTGIGFMFIGSRNLEDVCRRIKLVVTAYYPRPVPAEHCPAPKPHIAPPNFPK